MCNILYRESCGSDQYFDHNFLIIRTQIGVLIINFMCLECWTNHIYARLILRLFFFYFVLQSFVNFIILWFVVMVIVKVESLFFFSKLLKLNRKIGLIIGTNDWKVIESNLPNVHAIRIYRYIPLHIW